ncbi:response regulator [Paenibacillus sp. NPDC058910]|uniref:response regulator transcription factor n=1 Tax=unclassified Paenibacillus TaxID=185978 RepID=UPI0036B37521
MYRVLLVDDEAIARTGLRSTFDWEKYGYRLVGEASNGQRAMKWILNGDLDILITDIAMPVMDGLELTRRTRELCPWVKVLLLSCHSDFEFVREGIRLGASDYILKPTLDADSLGAVLDRMRLKLEEEKQMQRILTEHEQQQRLNQKKAAEKVLFQALSGEPGALAKLEAWNHNGPYLLAVLQLNSDPGAGAAGVQHKDWHDEIERLMGQLYDQAPEALAARLETDRIAVYVPLRHAGRLPASEHEAAIRLPIRCAMGLSRRYNGMDKLQEAFREASECLEGLFFHKDQQILRAGELPLTEADSAQERPAAELHALRAALTVGNMDISEERLQSIMLRWQPGRMKKRAVLREAEELLSLLAMFHLPGCPPLPQIGEVGKLRSVEEVKELVLQGLHTLREEAMRHPVPESTLHERIVLQAVQYIKAHFTEPISLQEVADEVAVSRNYFSELFKRVTGHNFIDYVIDLRLKRAKELLSTTSLRVYEVADRSGFNDVKYFSKLFKKLVGMTPAEYQGQHRK